MTIGSLWAIMKRQLLKNPQTSVGALKQKSQFFYNLATAEECEKLNRMSQRISAVLKGKMDVTQY